jgi:hypothetical protein
MAANSSFLKINLDVASQDDFVLFMDPITDGDEMITRKYSRMISY